MAGRFVGATSPIFAASRDVVLADIEADWARAFSIIAELVWTPPTPPLLASFAERVRSMIVVKCQTCQPHRGPAAPSLASLKMRSANVEWLNSGRMRSLTNSVCIKLPTSPYMSRCVTFTGSALLRRSLGSGGKFIARLGGLEIDHRLELSQPRDLDRNPGCELSGSSRVLTPP